MNLPEISEQKKIAEILDCLDQEIFHLESKLNLFQTQKQGLMQQLGTGHLKRDRRISAFFIGLKWTFQHLSLIS